MANTDCLTASMLSVGTRFRTELGFSREQVEQYCALSGDKNAIHRDLEAARLRFPDVKDIVVPGGQAFALPPQHSQRNPFVPQ